MNVKGILFLGYLKKSIRGNCKLHFTKKTRQKESFKEVRPFFFSKKFDIDSWTRRFFKSTYIYVSSAYLNSGIVFALNPICFSLIRLNAISEHKNGYKQWLHLNVVKIPILFRCIEKFKILFWKESYCR